MNSTLHGRYSNYHYCIIRECRNTSIKTPEKLWIKAPSDINMRNTWLTLAKRDPETLSSETQFYFCEDHFDLEKDMKNYIEYKVMGSVKRVIMKPNCVPTKFECLTARKPKPLPPKKKNALKKRVSSVEQTTSSCNPGANIIPAMCERVRKKNTVCCAVVGCGNSEAPNPEPGDHTPKNIFFKFPDNVYFCRLWAEAAGRPELERKHVRTLHKSYHICNIHFHSGMRLKPKLLRINAIPTINLPNTLHYRTIDTQTHWNIGLSDSYPSTNDLSKFGNSTTNEKSLIGSRKRKLSNTLVTTDSVINKKLQSDFSSGTISNEVEENYFKREEDIALEPESEFVVAQKKIQCILNQVKVSNPRVLTDNVEYKNLLMSLYYTSPLAYRLLYKTLKLPDEKIIRENYIDIVATKLSDSMIKFLKYKCNRCSNLEKVCVMSVSMIPLKSDVNMNTDITDEIQIKHSEHVAKNVVVVMIQGLLCQWKQPITYFFQRNDVDCDPKVVDWVNEIVTQVKSIGFDVIALTTDIELLFSNLTKNQDCTNKQNKDNTYYVFDVPPLLNNVRNTLMEKNFVFNDGTTDLRASWDDIKNLYTLEQSQRFRIAAKLTKRHINPSVFEKLNTKFAAQVFSRTVAGAIEYNVELGKLSVPALGTAALARRLNNVFDILNSSPKNVSESFCKYKRRFAGARYQVNYLLKFVNLLNTLRIVDELDREVTADIKCINYLKTTIKSILLISKDLKNKGFCSLFTRKLNVIKDFSKTKKPDQLTPTKYDEEFKKHIFNAIDKQRVDIPNEINIFFSAIDDIYVEMLKKKNKVLKANKYIIIEVEQNNVVKIKSEGDIVSNQNTDSESEENKEYTNHKENGEEEINENALNQNVLVFNSEQGKEVEVIKNVNKIKVENESMSLNYQIDNIMNSEHGIQSVEHLEDCIAYTVFKVEGD